MTDEATDAMLDAEAAIAGRVKQDVSRSLYDALFPDEDSVWEGQTVPDRFIEGGTIFARRRYPAHLEFFDAGLTYRERCFMAANRVGKTIVGAYELTAHLTGRYPDWWTGRRWEHPIRAWAAGRTNETTRDIVQATLLGDVRPVVDGQKGVTGTGVVPGALVGEVSWKAGVADLVDTVRVRHKTGEWSLLGFKSYQQGRGSFEGTGQQVIWCDEEPDESVYGECLVRTATTNGMIYLTFTPLAGRSQVVKSFLPTDWRPDV